MRETRLYISSLEPDPKFILDAVHALCGIENNLYWTLDATFDEDRCRSRSRKVNGALNLASIRHAALNIIRADPFVALFGANAPALIHSFDPQSSQIDDLGFPPSVR